jgi:hypothetical protein
MHCCQNFHAQSYFGFCHMFWMAFIRSAVHIVIITKLHYSCMLRTLSGRDPCAVIPKAVASVPSQPTTAVCSLAKGRWQEWCGTLQSKTVSHLISSQF